MDYEEESFGGYMDKPMTHMHRGKYHANYINAFISKYKRSN